MPLTSDTPRAYQQGDLEDYPMAASTTIYEGSAVGEDGSGNARPLQAGDVFLGFATRKVDNAAGAAGAKNCQVRTRGRIELPVGSAALADNDRAVVYASDDSTFTKTAGSNSQIGWVSRFVSTGIAVVEFEATRA